MTSITRTVTVRLDPTAAFEAFTSDMDVWYPRGPYSFNYPDRAVGITLEPGVGGRWLEVWRDGDGYEMGRVLAWEPGRRLLVSYRNRYLPDDPLTEIEVRFDPVAEGTCVTLEHRGWERLPAELLRQWAGRAWKGLMATFADHTEGMRSTMAETTLETQAVVPMLAYEDGVAAMDWLVEAFGFVERTRWLDDDGRLSHGELVAGGGLVMLAGGIPGYEGPRRHREHCAAAAKWSEVPWVINGIMIRVDDVDAHFERAKQAGARILSEPEDQPYGRTYRVEDLEGQRWMFQQAPSSTDG
jgi:PhnB protein